MFNFLKSLTLAYRARPGFEPGISRTRAKNHTPRPTSHTNGGILVGINILYRTKSVYTILAGPK